MAKAAPADIQDLLGGALFKALYKWMKESGPVYLLPTGLHPTSRLNVTVLKHSCKQHLSVTVDFFG